MENYITFSSPSSFTLAVNNAKKNWDGALECSTDADTWSEWDGTTTLSADNGLLYVRGTGNTCITGDSSKAYWVLTGSDISCGGNIENVLDYAMVARGEHPTMSSYCYHALFFNCKSLTTAPELPATTLSKHCYRNMFYDCTNLRTAPELPATTLSYYCYTNMFRGCTSLTTAPELPATTLADYCYRGMFYDCTGLTTAPELPATTLTENCYRNMFYGCKSLTTIPELPATTLTDNCYAHMFRGCTSIKLSSSQSDDYQTPYRIPTSGVGITTTTSLTDMFTDTGGTFTGEPSINTTYYTSNEVIYEEPEPETPKTTITYNGKTIATLEAGQTATIKTAQSEVEHDIVVKAGGTAAKLYDGSVTIITGKETGLYETGTDTLVKSWDELISERMLTVTDGVVVCEDNTIAGDLVLSNDVTSIGNGAFMRTGLTSVVVPDSVTLIGDLSFRECLSLRSINIPDSVTEIGPEAFCFCKSLTNVTFGENSQLTTFFDFTFSGCTSLTSFTIPNGVERIGRYVFSGCTSLTNIYIPDSVMDIYNNAFESTSLIDTAADGVQYVSNWVVGCVDKSVTNLTLREGTRGIANEVFKNCTSLTSVHFPDSMAMISPSAFKGCTSLSSVNFPDNITLIGAEAFYDCSSLKLTSVVFPESVEFIRSGAFQSCRFTTITFKGTPTSIDSTAFKYCFPDTINVPWAEGEVANAPWGATSSYVTINYNYKV